MIDWERVAELREEIGPENFAEVVELFLDEVEAVLGRLDTTRGDEAFAEDLHFLKGSALNLGFRRFGLACHEGEARAAAGQAGAVDVAAILACYEASRQCFLGSGIVRAVA